MYTIAPEIKHSNVTTHCDTPCPIPSTESPFVTSCIPNSDRRHGNELDVIRDHDLCPCGTLAHFQFESQRHGQHAQPINRSPRYASRPAKNLVPANAPPRSTTVIQPHLRTQARSIVTTQVTRNDIHHCHNLRAAEANTIA